MLGVCVLTWVLHCPLEGRSWSRRLLVQLGQNQSTEMDHTTTLYLSCTLPFQLIASTDRLADPHVRTVQLKAEEEAETHSTLALGTPKLVTTGTRSDTGQSFRTEGGRWSTVSESTHVTSCDIM